MRLAAKISRSLATAGAGEFVTVEQVLFDYVRARCSPAGIVRGATLQITATTPKYVRLLTARGTATRLERALAHFVAVTTALPHATQSELQLSSADAG